MENRPEDSALGRLTPRERDVLALLRLGLTNQEIAERLGISADGAKYHVSEIIGKLAVRDRYEAASWPERRPWWTAALTPAVLLWRSAGALVPINLSWVAAATSAGLLVTVLGGTGLMAVLLVRSDDNSGSETVLTNSRTRLVAGEEREESLGGDEEEEVAPSGEEEEEVASGGEDEDEVFWPALASASRSTLSICVDGAGGAAVFDTDVSVVQQALNESLGPALERSGNTSIYPPTGEVVGGCPAATLPLGVPVTHDVATESYVQVWEPDAPSPHKVFVYFVPASQYSATFGSEPYFRAAAEMLCSGHVCGEVTTGLYVSELASDATLQEGLLDALGLLEREPDPPTDWEACEVDMSAGPWCERYDDWKELQEELQQAEE